MKLFYSNNYLVEARAKKINRSSSLLHLGQSAAFRVLFRADFSRFIFLEELVLSRISLQYLRNIEQNQIFLQAFRISSFSPPTLF